MSIKKFLFGQDDDSRDGTSPFDEIRREDEKGEYWSARELMPHLGYGKKWQNFRDVIKKAKIAFEAAGLNPSDWVTDVSNPIRSGKGRLQDIEDFRLTRRACYMVAICGDSSKPEVAAAKNYFVIKTREAELGVRDNSLLSRKTRAWINMGKDWDWIERRLKGQGHRAVFTETLRENGVMPGYGFALCTDTLNKEVIGKTAKEIKVERGVQRTRDSFSHMEVVAMMFAEALSTKMIEQNDGHGISFCNGQCKIAGTNTKKAIDDSLKPQLPDMGT